MAEAGENSHGKNNLCKIKILTINTDERPKTVAGALPSVQKIMKLGSALIQAESANCWQLICLP
jgi:hypothetical protein